MYQFIQWRRKGKMKILSLFLDWFIVMNLLKWNERSGFCRAKLQFSLISLDIRWRVCCLYWSSPFFISFQARFLCFGFVGIVLSIINPTMLSSTFSYYIKMCIVWCYLDMSMLSSIRVKLYVTLCCDFRIVESVGEGVTDLKQGTMFFRYSQGNARSVPTASLRSATCVTS